MLLLFWACATPDSPIDTQSLPPPIEEMAVDCTGKPLFNWYQDQDGDGYGDLGSEKLSCTHPIGWINRGGDCDDQNPQITPATEEICDGIDNNCDGKVDDGFNKIWFRDGDHDNYGNTYVSFYGCNAPTDYIANGTDCNDTNALIAPNQAEICDMIDNDCDFSIDEGVLSQFYIDLDQDGYGDDWIITNACSVPNGFSDNALDCDDSDETIYPTAIEACNGYDDNCDGLIDADCLP